jgi:hypothetical protein
VARTPYFGRIEAAGAAARAAGLCVIKDVIRQKPDLASTICLALAIITACAMLFVRAEWWRAAMEIEMPVSKRYDDALMERIDAVAWKGFSFIEWWELNAWYDAQRIGRKVWRDIKERFDEAVDGDENAKDIELWIYEAESGIMLIHSDELKKVTDKIGSTE